MKVVLVILGFLAIAHCRPSDLIERSGVSGDPLVDKILAAIAAGEAEKKPEPAATTLAPVTTEKPAENATTTEAPKKEKRKEPTTLQQTDAKADPKDPDTIAVATNSLTKKDKRSTVQTTNAEGATAVSAAKLEHKGDSKGPLVQSTSAKGGKIAVATSSMTTGSEEKKPEVPPVAPVEPPPAAPAPAPSTPEVPLPTLVAGDASISHPAEAAGAPVMEAPKP